MTSLGMGRALLTAFSAAALACADFPYTDSRTLTEGEYRGLRVGQSKAEALAALRTASVEQVSPDFVDSFWVTSTEELHRFDGIPGIAVGTGVEWEGRWFGAASIAFDGDEVESLYVAPIYPKWSEILSLARTRAEMYEALRVLMARQDWRWIFTNESRLALRPRDPALHAIPTGSPSAEELVLLEKYDRWEGSSVYGTEGSWQVDLLFRGGALREIQVDEWKGERIF